MYYAYLHTYETYIVLSSLHIRLSSLSYNAESHISLLDNTILLPLVPFLQGLAH